MSNVFPSDEPLTATDDVLRLFMPIVLLQLLILAPPISRVVELVLSIAQQITKSVINKNIINVIPSSSEEVDAEANDSSWSSFNFRSGMTSSGSSANVKTSEQLA